MTSELQQNRYDQLVRRVGGIIGVGSKVNEVITELFPMFDVENMPGELLILSGTRLCLGSSQLTAAAGERPRVQLFNPVDSGSLIAVSSFIVSSPGTVQVLYSLTQVALPSLVVNAHFRDTRAGFSPDLPLGQIREESAAALPTGTGRFSLGGSVTHVVSDEDSIAVLGPGTALEVGLEQTASTLRCTFNWRERPAQQSELNL